MSNPDDLPMSPFGSHIGIEIVESGGGTAFCRLLLQPYHQNTGGRVHGGVLTALADTTAGVAVRSIRPQGKLSATTDLSIAFIRPPLGETLEAHARIIHAGKRLLRCEVEVYSEEKLIAKTSATFMLVDLSD